MQGARCGATVIAEISGSSTQPAAGVLDINASISGLDRMTRRDVALADRPPATAKSPRRQAPKTTAVVAAFSV